VLDDPPENFIVSTLEGPHFEQVLQLPLLGGIAPNVFGIRLQWYEVIGRQSHLAHFGSLPVFVVRKQRNEAARLAEQLSDVAEHFRYLLRVPPCVRLGSTMCVGV
jgi:hypothetical protein